MQSARVKAFKNELRNYSFYLSRIEALQSLIDLCYDHLPGALHGNDPSRIPMNTVPNKDMEYRIRAEIEHHERNRRATQGEIDKCDQILGLMETSLKTAVKRIYVNGERTDKVAMDMYLSANALHNRINREIERVLDEFEETI